MTRHVALLRGLNVGGNNRLPMADLAAIFREVGAEDVKTYIQSGNVVFTAGTEVAFSLPARVSTAIEAKFGFASPVVTRTAREWAQVERDNPFYDEPEESLHVAFLGHWPMSNRVESLDPERSPGDRFTVVGREVYLCLPNGVARSKLTNEWLDKSLQTVSTLRNWKTIQTLGEWVKG